MSENNQIPENEQPEEQPEDRQGNTQDRQEREQHRHGAEDECRHSQAVGRILSARQTGHVMLFGRKAGVNVRAWRESFPG